MRNNKPIHHHKVHQSLINPAEMRGVKLQWFFFLIAIAFIFFPMTSGSVLGFIVLGVLLWSLLTFVLRPLYQWDNDAIIVLLQAISQDQYHQPGDDINGPSKPAFESIQTS
jgi:hypothetical protein